MEIVLPLLNALHHHKDAMSTKDTEDWKTSRNYTISLFLHKPYSCNSELFRWLEILRASLVTCYVLKTDHKPNMNTIRFRNSFRAVARNELRKRSAAQIDLCPGASRRRPRAGSPPIGPANPNIGLNRNPVQRSPIRPSADRRSVMECPSTPPASPSASGFDVARRVIVDVNFPDQKS